MTRVSAYEIDEDPARIDVDVVWEFLSTEADWARERTRDEFVAQLADAWRVVGVYRRGTGEQVGFARAIATGPTFAYLADVFVVRSARGAGLGAAIVEAMVDDERYPGIKWMLFTSTAHGLYTKFGFTVLNEEILENTPMVRAPRV